MLPLLSFVFIPSTLIGCFSGSSADAFSMLQFKRPARPAATSTVSTKLVMHMATESTALRSSINTSTTATTTRTTTTTATTTTTTTPASNTFDFSPSSLASLLAKTPLASFSRQELCHHEHSFEAVQFTQRQKQEQQHQHQQKHHRYHPQIQDSPSPTIATMALKHSIPQHLISSPSFSHTHPPVTGYGDILELTKDEKELFRLLQAVKRETGLSTTLRVAGGWVRDKLLATHEFNAYPTRLNLATDPSRTHSNIAEARHQQRITRKFQQSAASLGRQGVKVLLSTRGTTNGTTTQQPVDIDIALDDMLGREFADYLNQYLPTIGEQTVSIGMVLQNPEKSKHLETATVRVNQFWLDLVNLRAEQYAQGSRIPDSMRIGTALEDAFRRDLTINALFYNIQTGQVEDWTGKGLADLRKGIVATPLPALTTLLDDPLRVLRSVRFAARLRFTMSDELTKAAKTTEVLQALRQKVSRERVGGELDLMIRSPDPVGAVRLLVNLGLADCVIPASKYYNQSQNQQQMAQKKGLLSATEMAFQRAHDAMQRGLHLLGTCHDYVTDCRWSPPLWCQTKATSDEMRLVDDEESRRLLWYATLLKPVYEDLKVNDSGNDADNGSRNRKNKRSVVMKLLVDDLKRPVRDAEAIESILKAADEFTHLLRSGGDVSSTMILLSDIRVRKVDRWEAGDSYLSIIRNTCTMNGRRVDWNNAVEDPIWAHAMEFRWQCSKVLKKIGRLWRAAMILSIASELDQVNDDMEYAIEGDVLYERQEEERDGILERFDIFAAALQNIGLIGHWDEKPLLDGKTIQEILPSLPYGPAFRAVMDEQVKWMTMNPCCPSDALVRYLRTKFHAYALERVPQR
jgi:tRNA nucleotidyltransferase/poly(A) polymerase